MISRLKTWSDYADGLLTGERKTSIEAHLQHCPICQQRALSQHDISRLLRPHLVGQQLQPETTPLSRVRTARLLRLVAAILVLVLVIAVGLPLTTSAGFPLARFLNFAEEKSPFPVHIPGDQEPPGTPVTARASGNVDHVEVAFAAVQPGQLPLGLELVEATAPQPNELWLVYQSSGGLFVELFQTSEHMPQTSSVPASHSQATVIQDTEILLQIGGFGKVVRALWERRDIVFDIHIIRAPGLGPDSSEFLELVDAVITAQDGGNGP